MGSLWNRSGVIERYGADDLPARSAKAYFFLGGTTSPMTVYADAGEASAHPHPVVADSNGRWPNIFVPYTLSYDVLVQNEFNVELTYTQEIPNPDPVELTVEVPPPDPGDPPEELPASVLLATGMTHWEPIQVTKIGFVRCNGRTIGNGVSGGTERANADCEALFAYLWNAMANAQAAVSGGRGASPAADFTAGKTIALPDLRGALPIGLDNMGNIAGGFFGTGWATPSTVGSPIIPGSILGTNIQTITFNSFTQVPGFPGILVATSATAIPGVPSPPPLGATSNVTLKIMRVVTGTWYMKL